MRQEALNLDARFRAMAAAQPQAPAIFGPDRDAVLTYEALDALIADLARALAQAGVQGGRSLGLHLPSGKSYIVATYAAWRLGAAVVPIPIELVAGEKRQLLHDIKVDAVIAGRDGVDFATPFLAGEVCVLDEATAIAPIASPRAHPDGYAAIDTAFIRFTSGTTGRSKGVVLSHQTIGERISAANAGLALGPHDRVLWLLSMSYHFSVSIAGYLSLGAAIILPRNHLAPEILASAVRHGATVIYGSPAHYEWLADASDQPELPKLRLAISTTAALDRTIAEKFLRHFNVPLSQALGIIEIGLPCINVDAASAHPESVGRPLPAYRMKLEDVGFGEHCQEILFAGPGCLDAYYEPWQPRAAIMPGGWFRTGDVGEVDDDGYLFLHGRAKDVINVMGLKFFPHEVESILALHPDVVEAVVLPERDVRLGEVPFARVVLKDGRSALQSERGLLDYCRRHMASYKVPTRIEFVASLPRTASGKVLHRPGLDSR